MSLKSLFGPTQYQDPLSLHGGHSATQTTKPSVLSSLFPATLSPSHNPGSKGLLDSLIPQGNSHAPQRDTSSGPLGPLFPEFRDIDRLSPEEQDAELDFLMQGLFPSPGGQSGGSKGPSLLRELGMAPKHSNNNALLGLHPQGKQHIYSDPCSKNCQFFLFIGELFKKSNSLQ